MNSQMDRVPDHIIKTIFEYLSDNDRLSFAFASSRWLNLANQSKVLSKIIELPIEISPIPPKPLLYFRNASVAIVSVYSNWPRPYIHSQLALLEKLLYCACSQLKEVSIQHYGLTDECMDEVIFFILVIL